jgi:uncharacterized protein DUF1566
MTGLTWQHDSAVGLRDWAGAKSYCAGLGLAGGGWSLPMIVQLYTLVLETAGPDSCYISSCAFFYSCADFFWSSSSPYPLYAQYIDFYGGVTSIDEMSSLFEVVCVR